MADLSNLSISESFAHLLQVSKSATSTHTLYDGTGSAVTKLDINGEVSASSFTGSFVGDGSGLTGIAGGIFVLTGSRYNTTQDVEITGSLTVTGPISASAFLGGIWSGSGDGTSIIDTIGAHTVGTTIEHSIIAGGLNNTMDDNDRSGILAGSDNTIQGNTSQNAIAGGYGNTIDTCTYAFIGGGINNTLSSLANGSAILGGSGNTIDTVDYSVILGGENITATHNNTAYAQRLQVLEDTSLTGSLTVSGGAIDMTGVSAFSASVFSGSYVNIPTVHQFAVSDETTDLTTGSAKLTFRMPYAMILTDVRASLTGASTGSTVIADVNIDGTSILSTKVSVDAGEFTSTTAATAVVIEPTSRSIADDAEVKIDIDQIGSSGAGTGLKLTLKGNRVS